ncbi:MAG: tyrosine-type recombinase/integrase [Butyrivibrio sp.]|nr:tyrosine-type recombinase/integrase [Butyrivibrio sp.]
MKSFKRANGSGTVYRLNDANRRKPFVAAVSVWGNSTGERKRHIIGTFSTWDEAMASLLSFNNMNLSPKGYAHFPFSEIFSLWSAQHFDLISQSTRKMYLYAYRNAFILHDKAFNEITLEDLENSIISCNAKYPTAKIMKNLFCQLYKYAIPRDIVSVNYAEYINLSFLYKQWQISRCEKRCFTDDEIATIYLHAMNDDFFKTVYMLLYSGLRISEFLNLKASDCFPDERYIYIRNSKTPSGIRKVPIADKTISFWKYFCTDISPDSYVIHINNRSFEARNGYDAYYGHRKSLWKTNFSKIRIIHTVHETRHTCETLLRRADVYPSKINAIIGHSGNNIGEKVYTHYSVSDLIPEINKI